MKCVAYIPRMVGVHSVRRRGRFISPVYVFYCFVVRNSLCPCMFFVDLWLGIRCARVCFLLICGCECICGHDKSAYTVGVRSVHGWCLQHIRLLLVAYIMVVCTVFSG